MSFELTNVLITVTRYFGGVKFGTSGLIVAYRSAASDSLDKMRKLWSIRFTLNTSSHSLLLSKYYRHALRAHDAEMLVNDADLEGYVWTIKIADSNKEALRRRRAGFIS